MLTKWDVSERLKRNVRTCKDCCEVHFSRSRGAEINVREWAACTNRQSCKSVVVVVVVVVGWSYVEGAGEDEAINGVLASFLAAPQTLLRLPTSQTDRAAIFVDWLRWKDCHENVKVSLTARSVFGFTPFRHNRPGWCDINSSFFIHFLHLLLHSIGA
ncbi:unnamed protein product [Protopolystoma xenopodis]|uniref:Uncharacterized protein n=1 Tax=Protopolystoma xenopodis TaxID=117903 RepID=A0A3S5CS74_9PLAT|nr:unnamed protein product [Protopolystoma xenopodis]